ncbi:hypothetical protein EGM51_13730 [Verrucomicrobia bacterium S94]|nr:hypothetical protein EGM51_13730 [Verrucomicrobia bacterium S94]
MPDYSALWETHTLLEGETLVCCVGPLTLRIHRKRKDWYVSHEQEMQIDDQRCSLEILREPMNRGFEWSRWILDEAMDCVRLEPSLPDRSIIVRPEMLMTVMPKQTVEFYIGLPLWLSISFGSAGKTAVEVPTYTLSNSWFGSFTEGELCYALKTTARLHLAELSNSAHRVVFPLNVKNLSKETLAFERICIRPQHLNIYQGSERLWTGRGRVSYRGRRAGAVWSMPQARRIWAGPIKRSATRVKPSNVVHCYVLLIILNSGWMFHDGVSTQLVRPVSGNGYLLRAAAGIRAAVSAAVQLSDS